jgi:hypothetical protein
MLRAEAGGESAVFPRAIQVVIHIVAAHVVPHPAAIIHMWILGMAGTIGMVLALAVVVCPLLGARL